MKMWTKLGIGAGVLATVVGASAVALDKSGDKTKEGETFKVQKGTLELAVTEVGKLEPLRKIEIKSKVAGQVEEVLVDVGHKVRAGDVLMRLVPLDADRTVAGAKARAQVVAANLEQARAELAIRDIAYANHAISVLELSVTKGLVRRLEAEARVAEVEVQRALDQLGYTKIRAPIDGTVLARNVQPGEMVTPGVASLGDGKPLLVVAQTASLLVRTELNQLDIAKVRMGLEAEIKVDALPGKTFRGKVHLVAAMGQKSERRKDSSLQVFPVDVLVPMDQDGAWAMKPGMMAEVKIPVEAKEDVLAVPVEAIVREDGKTLLLKLENGEELKVNVLVGAQNDQRAEILSGIDAGDTIRLSPSAAERKN